MKNRIKELRIKQKMSQNDLALKSGLTRPYISKLENNEVEVVKSNTMIAISKALKKPIQSIFFNSE